jgi:hypothetical protein
MPPPSSSSSSSSSSLPPSTLPSSIDAPAPTQQRPSRDYLIDKYKFGNWRSIANIYTEYHYGINRQLSLKDLEQQFGTSWRTFRSDNKLTKMFLKRKALVMEVDAQRGATLQEKLDHVEVERRRFSGDKYDAVAGQDLPKFATHLYEKSKATHVGDRGRDSLDDSGNVESSS